MKNVKFAMAVHSSYSISCYYYESLTQLLDFWQCESIEELVNGFRDGVNCVVFEVNKVWSVIDNG